MTNRIVSGVLMAVRNDSSADGLPLEHSGYDLLNSAASHLPMGIISEDRGFLQWFSGCDGLDV